jgi:hypothetical protein
MKAQPEPVIELLVEPVPLMTLRGRRGGPLPAFMNVDVLRAVLGALQRGAWDYVACEAAGVPKGTFEEWMRRGRSDRAADRDTEYSRFSGLVERARALARVKAEMQVFKTRPDLWLTKGPGRERSRQAGLGNARGRGPCPTRADTSHLLGRASVRWH